MKKWAKILLVIGIIWVIASGFFAYYGCSSEIRISCESGVDCPIPSNICSLDALVVIAFILGIPAWIMFLVIGVWGRGKK